MELAERAAAQVAEGKRLAAEVARTRPMTLAQAEKMYLAIQRVQRVDLWFMSEGDAKGRVAIYVASEEEAAAWRAAHA